MRLLSLLLAGVMVLALAACSKEEAQDTPPQQQNEQKDKSPQQEETPPVDDQEEQEEPEGQALALNETVAAGPREVTITGFTFLEEGDEASRASVRKAAKSMPASAFP